MTAVVSVGVGVCDDFGEDGSFWRAYVERRRGGKRKTPFPKVVCEVGFLVLCLSDIDRLQLWRRTSLLFSALKVGHYLRR